MTDIANDTTGRLRLTEAEIADFGIPANHVTDDYGLMFMESDVERVVTQRVRDTASAAPAVDAAAAVDAVLAVLDGIILRESNRVYEWPEDEADLHRNGEHRSFTERAAAVSRLRAEKIVAAVLGVVTVHTAATMTAPTGGTASEPHAYGVETLWNRGGSNERWGLSMEMEDVRQPLDRDDAAELMAHMIEAGHAPDAVRLVALIARDNVPAVASDEGQDR